MPLTMHPLYQKYDIEIPIAKGIWREFVTLPLFPELADEQIEYVIKGIREFDNQINYGGGRMNRYDMFPHIENCMTMAIRKRLYWHSFWEGDKK